MYIEKKILEKMYIENKWGMSRIVKELGLQGIKTSVGFINGKLKEYGITIRNASQAATTRTGKYLDHSKTYMNENIIEFIDGFLLGDGKIKPNNKNTAKSYCNVLYKDFCEYMRSGFLNYLPNESFFSPPKENSKKSGQGTWSFCTLSHPDLYDQYNRWYPNGIKKIPKDIRITPISVMLWYLGHGTCFQHNKKYTIRLTTGKLNIEDVKNILITKLQEEDISCFIKDGTNRIILNEEGIQPFFNFIGSKSPIECYSHKFDLGEYKFIESKRMSKVCKELNLEYNKLAYWTKMGFVPSYRTSEVGRPRFLKEHIEKIKEYIEYDKNNPKLEKYGVENPFQSPEIKEQIKLTNLEKYGVEYPTQSLEIKEKTIQTNLEKYGCENPLQNEEVKEKGRQTNLEKYGFSNPTQNSGIKEKIINQFNITVKENNNEYYNQINILRTDEFWKDLKTMNLLNVSKKYNLNSGSLRSKLLDTEFREKYYNTYSFPKTQKQKEVKDFLEKLGFKVSFNNRSIITPLELDIYIEEKKFAIEFNGDFWHSEYILDHNEAKNKHINKTKLCESKGIRLIHIFEHQWDNRKDQFCNFIRSTLGKSENKIYARDCGIDESEQNEFLDQNHIQGSPNSVIKWFNLKYGKDIIGSMTASIHHRVNDKNDIVLSRLCFKDNYYIIGGVERLFKRFVEWAKIKKYDNIISWSDNCWTFGEVYKKLNFELVKEYGPDYFYWDLFDRVVISKQSQMKSKTGCPEDITEVEFCKQNGLFRIWDSGKRLWVFKL